MKLFPQDENVILYKTGFEEDFLERKSISKQLSSLVDRMESPVVIALDDKWGSGKTYFLKRWVAAHKKENDGSAVTVYFDAFESDYISDPIVSIITAVSERITKEQESTLEKWRAVATKLAKPTFGIALALATFGAKQHLDELGDVLADAASSEGKDAAQSLWDAEKERRDAIKSFKDLLIKLTDGEAAPIVIVVDELDRCRLDYALSVLEVIKHFFSVPKVHFILGINGEALENSVKARYGVDVDAEAYLRKFINVSFSLPRSIGPRGRENVVMKYSTQLIADMRLLETPSNECLQLISYVCAENSVSLRDIGKIFSKISLLPQDFFANKKLPGWIDILCVLIVSSVLDPTLHKKLVSASASIAQIRQFLGAPRIKTTELIDRNRNPEYNHPLTVWLATIIFACGSEASVEDESLPSWAHEVGERFDRFGSPRDAKRIPAQIQRDWVDVFRI